MIPGHNGTERDRGWDTMVLGRNGMVGAQWVDPSFKETCLKRLVIFHQVGLLLWVPLYLIAIDVSNTLAFTFLCK